MKVSVCIKMQTKECVSWYTNDHPTVADKCAMILNICETLDNTIDKWIIETQGEIDSPCEELGVGFIIIHEAVTQIKKELT